MLQSRNILAITTNQTMLTYQTYFQLLCPCKKCVCECFFKTQENITLLTHKKIIPYHLFYGISQ